MHVDLDNIEPCGLGVWKFNNSLLTDPFFFAILFLNVSPILLFLLVSLIRSGHGGIFLKNCLNVNVSPTREISADRQDASECC